MSGKNWQDIARNAIRTRNDYSASLTHWTRRTEGMTAFDVLKRILDDRRIIASTTESGFIKGTRPATCFTETPVTAIGRAFMIRDISESAQKYLKWDPYGLSFIKSNAYQRLGARPVFYASDSESEELFPRESPHLWRVVRFDLSNTDESVDFLHEREWRVPGDVDLSALSGFDRPLAIVQKTFEADEIKGRYLSGDAATSVIRGVFSLMDLRLLG
jgi:hypothetical protein